MKRYMLHLCTIALAIWGLCASIQAQTPTYQDYVKQALAAMAVDSLQQADSLFKQALKAQPAQRSNALIYYQLGRMAEYQGHTLQAFEYYDMGLNIAPHVLPLRLARGGLFVQTHQEDKAISDYSDVLDWKPMHEEALFMRAFLYSEKRLYKKARIDYEALLRQQPRHVKARAGLALLNDKDGRPREALEQMNALVTLHPDSAWLYALRGGMLQSRKLYEAAEADFTQAIQLSPAQADYYLSRARLYADTRRKKQALADLDKALSLGADPMTIASLKHEIH